MSKGLCKQSKMLVASVIQFFIKENDNGAPLVPLNAINERVTQAMSISIVTVGKIRQSIQINKESESPKRKRQRKKPVTNITRSDETSVRNAIYQISWQDNTTHRVKSIKSEGTRYVIQNAPTKNGFVPGASKIFTSKAKDLDYHGEMNQNNFLIWFEEQLLKKLSEPSMIIMDNASYRSTLENKLPNSSSNKAQIKQWLTGQNIPFEGNAYKKQLLQLVAMNKGPKIYIADTLAAKYGHVILRLPPYHCNKHIGRDGHGTAKCIEMWEEALGTITPKMCMKTVHHTEKVIEDWWKREVGFEREGIPELITNLNQDSSHEYSCSNTDCE